MKDMWLYLDFRYIKILNIHQEPYNKELFSNWKLYAIFIFPIWSVKINNTWQSSCQIITWILNNWACGLRVVYQGLCYTDNDVLWSKKQHMGTCFFKK